MNKTSPVAAVVLSTCLTLSCAEDGLTGLAGDLVGTWTLTKAEFISVADTTQREDLIEQGWVIAIDLRSNGRYVWQFTEPGVGSHDEPGTWRVEGTDVVLRSDADPTPEIRCSSEMDQGTVTLTTLNAERDLDGDGLDDPARLVMVLVRSPQQP